MATLEAPPVNCDEPAVVVLLDVGRTLEGVDDLFDATGTIVTVLVSADTPAAPEPEAVCVNAGIDTLLADTTREA